MPSSPNKEDYESLFNDIFGVEVGWSKMSKTDLEALAEIFTNPELLAERLVSESKEPGDHRILHGRIIEGITVGLIDTAMEHKGPLVSAIRRAVSRKLEENLK